MVLQEIYETGIYQWKVYQTKVCRFPPASFSETIAEFMGSFSLSRRYTAEIRNIIVRYAVFLEENGIDRFQNAEPENMRDFLAFMNDSRPKSMDKVVLSLRKLYAYFNAKEISCNSFWILLSSPRSRDHCVKPAIPQIEIVRLVDQIDLEKSPGKRDYAILVLAMTTGLRAGDISSLKLTDIFWKQGEIRITQGKTGHTLTLPLQGAARDALADYILNERPKSGEKHVFLRACAPYTAFYDGVSVACIFRRYLEKAGIRHQANDGRTFHGIRRALGTAMVAGGTPVTTVSQVLGHQSIRSTRQYIAMDLDGLRRCALPLSSIGGGV